jgi:hypothetical protein
MSPSAKKSSRKPDASSRTFRCDPRHSAIAYGGPARRFGSPAQAKNSGRLMPTSCSCASRAVWESVVPKRVRQGEDGSRGRRAGWAGGVAS